MYPRSFSIKTETFEGPLDLLLSLIEKRKLLINDVSLAKITDDYIEFIKNSTSYSIKENSHFILIASTLLLIKSKSLLPTLELTAEEQGSIEDLETRLKIYKVIKDSEKNITDIFGINPSFFSEGFSYQTPVFAPPRELNLQLIQAILDGILKNLPKKETLPKTVVKKIISLEETIGHLTTRIQQNISMSFKEFAKFGKEEKVNIVVSFLAMLELVKQGIIETRQANHFEDIEIQTKTINTPNYS
jgi:segregation and condensation protein A